MKISAHRPNKCTEGLKFWEGWLLTGVTQPRKNYGRALPERKSILKPHKVGLAREKMIGSWVSRQLRTIGC